MSPNDERNLMSVIGLVQGIVQFSLYAIVLGCSVAIVYNFLLWKSGVKAVVKQNLLEEEVRKETTSSTGAIKEFVFIRHGQSINNIMSDVHSGVSYRDRVNKYKQAGKRFFERGLSKSGSTSELDDPIAGAVEGVYAALGGKFSVSSTRE